MKRLFFILVLIFVGNLPVICQTNPSNNDDLISHSLDLVGGALYPGFIAGLAYQNQNFGIDGGWMGAAYPGTNMSHGAFVGFTAFSRKTYTNSFYLTVMVQAFSVAEVTSDLMEPTEIKWYGGTSVMGGYKFYMKTFKKLSMKIGLGWDFLDSEARRNYVVKGTFAGEVKIGYNILHK